MQKEITTLGDETESDFRSRLLRGAPHFNGATYKPQHDQRRLTGQIERVYLLMTDGVWRTLSEIEVCTGDASASISAQLRNLRKARFGSHQIEKRARGDRAHGLFEYRMVSP
jgi:hypothetical protein